MSRDRPGQWIRVIAVGQDDAFEWHGLYSLLRKDHENRGGLLE